MQTCKQIAMAGYCPPSSVPVGSMQVIQLFHSQDKPCKGAVIIYGWGLPQLGGGQRFDCMDMDPVDAGLFFFNLFSILPWFI